MPKRGKKYNESKEKISAVEANGFEEAVQKALESSYAKFDESVDVAVRLGVDPRHADQMVRGSVILPNGTGKAVKILVFAKGEKEKEALDAGADFAGSDELVEKIKGGWFGFDKAVATPDMMGTVGKIGRILGPRDKVCISSCARRDHPRNGDQFLRSSIGQRICAIGRFASRLAGPGRTY